MFDFNKITTFTVFTQLIMLVIFTSIFIDIFMEAKFKHLLVGGISILTLLVSCDQVEEILKSETDTEKTIRIFTKGGEWNVDSLVLKTDLFSGGISNVTTDSSFVNYGTVEFKSPNEAESGYGSGLMIHRYTKNGRSRIDTLSWVPYNFNTGNNAFITVFTMPPVKDPSGHKYLDLYLDLQILQEKKIKFSGWRRETIYGGSGGSYGWYRSYVLSRK
jgi:hypothetical protein